MVINRKAVDEREPRDIVEVIEQMEEKVPASEKDFLERLKSLRRSAEYSSPETMVLRWEQTGLALAGTFPKDFDDFEDWQKEVYDIWMDKENVEN